MDDGVMHIRYRPLDLSSLFPAKENRMRSHSNVPHSKSKGFVEQFIACFD